MEKNEIIIEMDSGKIQILGHIFSKILTPWFLILPGTSILPYLKHLHGH